MEEVNVGHKTSPLFFFFFWQNKAIDLTDTPSSISILCFLPSEHYHIENGLMKTDCTIIVFAPQRYKYVLKRVIYNTFVKWPCSAKNLGYDDDSRFEAVYRTLRCQSDKWKIFEK